MRETQWSVKASCFDHVLVTLPFIDVMQRAGPSFPPAVELLARRAVEGIPLELWCLEQEC